MRPCRLPPPAALLVALLALTACADPPLNPPFWAGQSVAELRQAFPAGRTRLPDIAARIAARPSSYGGPGVLDSNGVFFKRDSRTGALQAERTPGQPVPPLRPVTATVYVWFEDNPPPPPTRTPHERQLMLLFDGDGRLVLLDRFDRPTTRRFMTTLF